ncbi:MAG TPA: 4-carboxymuconolactone decarboxylase [Peptococcaceae bacterium]|nr:4-carboxymuconolactone decarboxylase [Peptococcaceae bacterium]
MKETQALLQQLEEGQEQLARNFPEVLERFHKLGQEVFAGKNLSPKFKELIAISVAVAIRCQPCIANHVKRALDQGATVPEILEACSVAIVMGGGPGIAYTSYVVKALKDLGAI